jgi:peptidylprolyl isomerase
MVLEKGSFIIVNYTAKIKETGKIFDTSIEEVAKKEKLNKEGERFFPKLIVIGEGWVIKTLDDSLVALEENKPSIVEIPPEKAFGPRNSELIKRVSLRSLLERGIRPKVGMMLEYSGKTATIKSIESGRVMIDLNHILAGKTLVYEVTLKKRLESQEEKILALIHRRMPTIEEEKVKLLFSENELTVKMPKEAISIENVQQMKWGMAQDIQKFFPEISSIKFLETFIEKPELRKEEDKNAK